MTHGAPTGQYKMVKEPTHRLTDQPTQTQRMTWHVMSRNQSRKRQNEIERRKKSKQTYRHVQVNFMSHAFKSSSCKMQKKCCKAVCWSVWQLRPKQRKTTNCLSVTEPVRTPKNRKSNGRKKKEVPLFVFFFVFFWTIKASFPFSFTLSFAFFFQLFLLFLDATRL